MTKVDYSSPESDASQYNFFLNLYNFSSWQSLKPRPRPKRLLWALGLSRGVETSIK